MAKTVKNKLPSNPLEDDTNYDDILNPTTDANGKTYQQKPGFATANAKANAKAKASSVADLESDEDSEDAHSKYAKLKEEEDSLPPFKSKCNWAQFIDYATALTENQRNMLVVYLYRLWPSVDNKILGRDKTIDTFTLTDDTYLNKLYIQKVHGGGRYMALVNKNGKTLTTIHETVPWTMIEPILNLATLVVGDKENAVYVNYLKAHGKLSPEGEIITPKGNTEMAENNALANVVTKLLDDKKEKTGNLGMDRLLEMMLAQQNQTQQLFLSLINRPQANEALGGVSSMVQEMQKQMLAMQTQFAQQQLDLQAKMIEMKAQQQQVASQQNPVDLISSAMKLMSMVKTLQANVVSEVAAPSIGDRILDTLQANAGPLINTIGAVVAQKLNTDPTTAATTTGAVLATMPQSTQPTQPNQKEENMPRPTKEQVLNEAYKLIFNPLFSTQIIEAIKTNAQGDIIANRLLDAFPQYETLVLELKLLGVSTIMENLKAHPQYGIYAALPEEKIKQFLTDFVSVMTLETTDSVVENETAPATTTLTEKVN